MRSANSSASFSRHLHPMNAPTIFDMPAMVMASDPYCVESALAENAVRLCSAERAFVHRYDGQFLRVAATHNVSPELRAFIESNPMAPGRYGVAARAALERRTVVIRDVQADPEITLAARGIEPVRTALSVPMLRSRFLASS
jgi:two-component system, NtrC family, sensor kinase